MRDDHSSFIGQYRHGIGKEREVLLLLRDASHRMIMSQQGAALQNYNNELVKCQ